MRQLKVTQSITSREAASLNKYLLEVSRIDLLTPEETQLIIKEIIEPTLQGCIEEGFPFRGILFLGLMMTGENVSPIIRADEEQDIYIVANPKLLEYNVRFGDPETQAILVRLESDLVEICEAVLNGTLADTPIKWRSGNSACIVLAAEGYPQKPRTGDPIHGLEAAAQVGNVKIFHAGTKLEEFASPESPVAAVSSGETSAAKGLGLGPVHPFITAGGRVLGVTATGESLESALSAAYRAVRLISWSGMQYRRDIGG